jgi:hypothetical protein
VPSPTCPPPSVLPSERTWMLIERPHPTPF